MKMKKVKIRLVIIGSLLFIVSSFLYFRFPNKSKVRKNSPPSVAQTASAPTKTPQPSPSANKKSLAAPGRQVYSISSTHRSPQIYKAIIDPEDVRVGQTQTMTVYVKEEKEGNSISSVVAKIQTDKETLTHDLKLKSGTDKDGVWEGSWIVHDTHDTTYVTTFIAKNNRGETAEARLSWTDPGCGCTGTNCTVSGSCTVSGVDGADGGTLTIGGSLCDGSVTVPASATLVYGATLNVSCGTLNVNNTGVVQSGNICMTDADSDNYPANTTQYAESTCGSGRRRRYLMTSITTTDCYDGNANAYPDQPTYYTTHRGDGSYDYNCDGSQTKQYDCASSFSYTPGCYAGKKSGVAGFLGGIPSCGQSGTWRYCRGYWSENCTSSPYCDAGSYTCGYGCCGDAAYDSWEMIDLNKTQSCR